MIDTTSKTKVGPVDIDMDAALAAGSIYISSYKHNSEGDKIFVANVSFSNDNEEAIPAVWFLDPNKIEGWGGHTEYGTPEQMALILAEVARRSGLQDQTVINAEIEAALGKAKTQIEAATDEIARLVAEVKRCKTALINQGLAFANLSLTGIAVDDDDQTDIYYRWLMDDDQVGS